MVEKFLPLASLRTPSARIEKMADDLRLSIERERRFGKPPDPHKVLVNLRRGQGETS